MPDALLIFIKNPERGKVKTRLAASLGDDRALAIYHLLLAHTRRVALEVPADRLLFYGQFIDEADDWPAAQFEKHLQHAGDLGLRMHQAFRYALDERGYDRAVLVGSDIAELEPGILSLAFNRLTDHAFVLGPARDGGYYLIGMKKPQASLFKGMTWSTPTVCAETQERMRALGQTPYLLPELSDVDYPEDWERVKDRFGSP